MKLRYWTVRAVPSANSITTIGIGVIVEDMATGEIAARFKKDSSQLAYMESQQSIMRLADELEQHVVHLACQHHRHSIGHELSVNGYLASLMDYWNNMLIIDEPKQVWIRPRSSRQPSYYSSHSLATNTIWSIPN